MSGKQARRKRQGAAAPAPVQRKGERRRASTRVLAIAAIVGLLLAGVAVAAAFVFGGSGSGSTGTQQLTVGSATSASALPNATDAQREFAGIPQRGLTLGSAKAPVTLTQYIDLQCPFCREFEATVMPTIVSRYVRTGKVRVVTRPIAFIGPDSLPARNAAIAAGAQNRAFPFMQVVYLNQGTENTGWLNRDFITKAASSVDGLDVHSVLSGMDAPGVMARGRAYDKLANHANIAGTPALFLARRGEKPTYVPSSQVLRAIQQAVR